MTTVARRGTQASRAIRSYRLDLVDGTPILDVKPYVPYDAIAPSYRAYVEADEKLDAPSKASRMRLLETWKLRIEANTKKK